MKNIKYLILVIFILSSLIAGKCGNKNEATTTEQINDINNQTKKLNLNNALEEAKKLEDQISNL